jgi:hypothetical protein
MNRLFSQPLFLFFLLVALIATPLLLFPINLFPGEIVLDTGVGQSTVAAPLSLAYFLGLGYAQEDMVGVVDFYLLPQGVALALILTIGVPAVFAYRVHLRGKGKK